MSSGHIPNINPSEDPRWRDFSILPRADNPPNLSVRFIQRVKRDVMFTRTKHHGRLNGDDIEMRLVVFDKVPRGLFGKGLGGTVACYMFCCMGCFVPRNWIPILFYRIKTALLTGDLPR